MALDVSEFPDDCKSAALPPLNAFVTFAYASKYTFTFGVDVVIFALFPPPYAAYNFDSYVFPTFTVMFPEVVPFMSFPPNTLQSGKLLPSTFIVASPAIVAAVEVFPFPPANTYPVIDNVLVVSPSVAFP